MSPIMVVAASQVLFTAGDLLARARMRQLGFHGSSFVAWWFVGYMTLRSLATFGQLWTLSRVVLGRTLPMFSASSVVLSMALSVVILKEGLGARAIAGGVLAVAALLLLATA